MIKANVFQELTNKAKEQQLQKQKRIQADTKLVEDELSVFYTRVNHAINSGVNPPKYTEIPKLLEKEVQENLVVEQNYFLDITKNGHTRIYYDKNDFDNRESNIIKQASQVSMGEYEKAKSLKNIHKEANNKEEVKEKKTTTEECMDLFELLQRIGLLHNRERSCR